MHTHSNIKQLSFIDFATLDKWYVSYYINPFSIISNYKLVKLKSIINPVKEKIKRKDYAGELKVVKKVSFSYGVIHLREVNETKMDLYVLHPNDLLVSKINFHQGAVAINKYEKIVCTTHYQPYSINRGMVIDEYLVLVLRNKHFQNHLEFLRAEGIKNEATYEFISELEIPLPSLSEQEKIIKNYYSKINEAKELQQNANNLGVEINDYLFEVLGINIFRNKKQDGFLSEISFQDIERWSVDFIKQSFNSSFIFNGKYAPVRFKEFIKGYQYGLSVKASSENIGIPMLRMNNINNSELIIDDLKYIPKTNDIDKFILDKGDLLFNRTNSKELVGKTALFELDDEFTFASYLIRVKINPALADCRYINYLFNSPILQFQKDLVSRQITGQANINAQEMREFLFPLPYLDKQIEIANAIKAMKDKIADYNSTAEKKMKEAEQEFENQIFS